MKKKIDKKNIIKYAGTGILTASIITGAGLCINDRNIDHTQEVCPITKMLNVIPTLDIIPFGASVHQWPEMKKDYDDRGISGYTIYYGEFGKNIVAPKKMIREDGTVVYFAPKGYILDTDDNGKVICVKYINNEKLNGYGFTTYWGEVDFNRDTNEFEFENIEYLKIK